MKPGVRALGIAESYRGDVSTICGAVVDTRGVVDGFSFRTCTVGGLDATRAILAIWSDAGRDDVQFVMLSGVALAWYNLVDFDRLSRTFQSPYWP